MPQTVGGIAHRHAGPPVNSMRQLDTFSDVVSTICDAALDASRWPDVLTAVARFTGGEETAILSRDFVGKAANVFHSVGFAPAYVNAYRDTYGALSPNAPLVSLDVGQVASTGDLVSDSEASSGPGNSTGMGAAPGMGRCGKRGHREVRHRLHLCQRPPERG